jgi:hypothetical protein
LFVAPGTEAKCGSPNILKMTTVCHSTTCYELRLHAMSYCARSLKLLYDSWTKTFLHSYSWSTVFILLMKCKVKTE